MAFKNEELRILWTARQNSVGLKHRCDDEMMVNPHFVAGTSPERQKLSYYLLAARLFKINVATQQVSRIQESEVRSQNKR